MLRSIALVLVATAVFPAAAVREVGAAARPVAQGSAVTEQAQTEVMRKYLRGLQAGSTIKIKVRKQGTLKATLMTVEDDAITVQPKTRVPEPVRTIPIEMIERVELDQGGGIGRAVAIGAAAGAGAALGVILILAAIFAND